VTGSNITSIVVAAGGLGTRVGSLRARLTAALDRNKQLADENARLRRQLTRALGDQRRRDAIR
jgi:regulator of replication initiation timing